MNSDTSPPGDRRKLLDASATIFGEPATAQDASYIPRELVQVTLPHKNPGNIPVWTRSNGNLTVGIQPGVNLQTGMSHGYPYGTVPRLLLFWITSEAIRTKSRRLELGHSLNGFMAALGLNSSNGSTGAKRSDARRLRDQMERLFEARISFLMVSEQDGQRGERRRNMDVVDDRQFWWDSRHPDQPVLWGSWIELGERFYDAITASPVPADMRALRALKRSPLALDLYAWLSYEAFRAHKGDKPRFESWTQLHAHLGAEYSRMNDFRRFAKAALAKIKAVYSGLKLGKRMGGIEVLPQSWPSIQPRNLTIEGMWTSL
ncbi:MAG: replication protein RepA [Terriglobia bacterium]